MGKKRERGRYLLSHSTEGELGIPLALLCDYQEKREVARTSGIQVHNRNGGSLPCNAAGGSPGATEERREKDDKAIVIFHPFPVVSADVGCRHLLGVFHS